MSLTLMKVQPSPFPFVNKLNNNWSQGRRLADYHVGVGGAFSAISINRERHPNPSIGAQLNWIQLFFGCTGCMLHAESGRMPDDLNLSWEAEFSPSSSFPSPKRVGWHDNWPCKLSVWLRNSCWYTEAQVQPIRHNWISGSGPEWFILQLCFSFVTWNVASHAKDEFSLGFTIPHNWTWTWLICSPSCSPCSRVVLTSMCLCQWYEGVQHSLGSC